MNVERRTSNVERHPGLDPGSRNLLEKKLSQSHEGTSAFCGRSVVVGRNTGFPKREGVNWRVVDLRPDDRVCGFGST